MLEIKPVSLEKIIPLRNSLLRPGKPVEDSYFKEDEMTGCFHLAVISDDKLVSIASFYPESHPELEDDNAWRLRGMATLPSFRGKGVGASLLQAGLTMCNEKGAKVLWCNARSEAVPFYSKLNFDIKGTEFVIEGVGPHYFMSYTF